MTLHRLPRALPPVPTILADLGNPPPADLARALAVSARTVFRWQATAWPRAAHLALFFVSTWGWSAIECDARFRVYSAEALARSLGEELERARQQLKHTMALADTGAANQPFMRA